MSGRVLSRRFYQGVYTVNISGPSVVIYNVDSGQTNGRSLSQSQTNSSDLVRSGGRLIIPPQPTPPPPRAGNGLLTQAAESLSPSTPPHHHDKGACMPFASRGCSSNGRALAQHARGTGIDTLHLHFASSAVQRLSGLVA